MKKELEDIAYKYYPKGISYFTTDNTENINYLKSEQFKRLNRLKSNFFEKGISYGSHIIDVIKDYGVEVELRDATNIPMGDRAFNIQHSSFFDKDESKYYPICFAISGLIPYYFPYIIDIDVSFDKRLKENFYSWVKNNGRLQDEIKMKIFKNTIDNISECLEKKLGYKRFPEELVDRVIPGIDNQNISMENFTFFNAFFMDDFYCLP